MHGVVVVLQLCMNPAAIHVRLQQSFGSWCSQGRIEPPKAGRGHATSSSPCIDGIVLSVTKNNISG